MSQPDHRLAHPRDRTEPADASSPDLVLASASPRRRELLGQLGLQSRVLVPDLDERRLDGEPAADYVRRLALAKARAGVRLAVSCGEPLSHAPVLAADTTVVIDDEPLGKPADADGAIAMLMRLSGREHQVLTAVAVVQALGSDHQRPTHAAGDPVPTRTETALSTSRVRFRPISPAEAAAYWTTGEPADKAGAYGIQGVGAIFVESLQGSFTGVVGLPLFETARLLERFGVRVLS